MKTRKTLLSCGLALALGAAGMAAQAAMLTSVDRLSIDAGVPVYDAYGNQTDVSGGSYFVCDCNGDFNIHAAEKTAMSPGWGGEIVGTHEPGEIDAWVFFGEPGSHYTTGPVTGGTTDGLDMSGWAMHWNGIDIPLGDGAWTPGNCGTAGVACAGYADGVAVFSWSGVHGDSYTLDYSAQFPVGSGLDGAGYFLHIEGVVSFYPDPPVYVPVPAAAWLFASGLVALGAARKRSRA